jgi:parvulin-like peptidyl-prolyl isomerase
MSNNNIDGGRQISEKNNRIVLAFVVGALTAAVSMAWYPGALRAERMESSLPDGLFAVIDGEEISDAEFKLFFSRYAQSKFYHGATQQDLDGIRKQAVEALIDQRLLAQEADRRRLIGKPDAVERRLKAYEIRYKDSEAWPQIREQWPALREKLLEQTKISVLEDTVRLVDDPGDAILNAYFQENLNLFTEPGKVRLSVILIGVDPSADKAEWDEARQKAEELSAMIASGSEFADLARQHSNHESAETGGDIGLLHDGMLSQPAQEAVDKLVANMVTPPVRVLEGHALFQLHERMHSQVHSFQEVRERALALYQREMSDRQWSSLISALRDRASVVVDVSL